MSWFDLGMLPVIRIIQVNTLFIVYVISIINWEGRHA